MSHTVTVIYLDYAATTPPSHNVTDTIGAEAASTWANPSSPHAAGRKARVVVDRARDMIAESIGFKPSEIIFTGGGSESVTLALEGFCRAWQSANGSAGTIVSQKTEHKAVLSCLDALERKGWTIRLLDVDEHGRISTEELKSVLPEATIASIQWGNNETGTLQPIEEIIDACNQAGVPLHCDMMQCVGILPFPDPLPDMMSIAAHKFYGPKGIGALLCKEHIELEPIIRGGGQEHALRSGTENVPGILGMRVAFEDAVEHVSKHHAHYKALREPFIMCLRELGGEVRGHPSQCLPNIINVALPDMDGETLVIKLDMHGICASTGSACTTGATEASHVLMAMGYGREDSRRSVRFSLGQSTTSEELERVIEVLRNILDEA